MSRIVKSSAVSVDKLCTHRIEIIVEFDEPVSFGEAQEMVSDAIGDYMCKQYDAWKTEAKQMKGGTE